MRGLLFVALVCAVGCGGGAPTTARPIDDPGAKDVPPTFDAKDMSASGKWMAWELNRHRDFPKGNAAAGAKKRAEWHGAIAGKSVAWPAKIVSISEINKKPVIQILPVSFEYAGNGPKRTYLMEIRRAGGLANQETLLPASGDWALKVAKGDTVIVKGTIKTVGYQGENDPTWQDPATAVERIDLTIVLDPVEVLPSK